METTIPPEMFSELVNLKKNDEEEYQKTLVAVKAVCKDLYKLVVDFSKDFQEALK